MPVTAPCYTLQHSNTKQSSLIGSLGYEYSIKVLTKLLNSHEKTVFHSKAVFVWTTTKQWFALFLFKVETSFLHALR